MTINIGGSLGLPQLAPDLTWPSTGLTDGITTITGIDVQGSLQTLLSATGKFSFGYLRPWGLTSETTTVKLTIDGVVVWNDVGFSSAGTELKLLGDIDALGLESPYLVESSFLLQMQTLTDASINLDYLLRPIA